MSMPAFAPQQANQRAAEPSMEEILASIRKIIAEDQKALEEKAVAVGDAVQTPLQASAAVNDDARPTVDQVAALEPVVEQGHEATPSRPAIPDAAALRLAVVSDNYVPPPVAPEAPVAAAVPNKAQPVTPVLTADEPQLLSPEAATMTSAAFNSLSNAVIASQSRTMDEIVTDLLRPMLSAWLDDNLPSLVERLVKAEIERVARGGR